MKVLLKALVLARLPIFSFAQGKPSGDLVVRFRHLAPIFACPRPNVEISRTTRNDKFLVAFLNLTFARRDCGIGDTNVKFTPLVIVAATPQILRPKPQNTTTNKNHRVVRGATKPSSISSRI